MSSLVSHVFEPGLFTNGPVQVAATVGGTVALVCGVVGVFTVMRGQAFASEALGDVGAMGGSAAFLTGINPLFGFVGVALAAAGVIEAIGFRRPRGHDLATGIVLGAGLGLAALFLYLDTTASSTSGASNSILFGSIFIISGSTVPLVVVLSAVTLLITALLYRMLLLSSVSPDLAAARGVSVRLVGAGFLIAMAIAVALAAMTIGAVLSTALLVGPAATALRLTRRPGVAVLLAALIGVATTWLGIVLSYDSYYWPPASHGWPVSFFVVTLIFVAYVGTHLRGPLPRPNEPTLEDLGL